MNPIEKDLKNYYRKSDFRDKGRKNPLFWHYPGELVRRLL